MRAADFQAAFARVCLAEHVAPADLDTLAGEAARWLLYRDMVRSRLARTIRSALPRTSAALGADFASRVDAFLASRPPQTRFLRDVPTAFADFVATPDARGGVTPTLARYERALWVARDVQVGPVDVVELDFERPTVVNPTAMVLTTRYAVWERQAPERALSEPHSVVVFRDLRTHRVATLATDPRLGTLLERIVVDGAPIGVAGRKLAADGAIVLDAAWIAHLVDRVGTWVERGLVLGSARV